MVAAGELGDIRFVSGTTIRTGWRSPPTGTGGWKATGRRAAVGGRHRHALGGPHELHHRPEGLEAVLAELATFIPERQKPTGPVETFTTAAGATETRVDTDDAAMILIRYPNGARGVMSTSQINVGRKNALRWDIAGSEGRPPGHVRDARPPLDRAPRRAEPDRCMRDFTLMNARARAAASLPPGHVEGFADSFHAFFRAVYRDVAAGGRQADSTWATFEDGHYEMLFCDAVLPVGAGGALGRDSGSEEREERRCSLGLLTAPFPTRR
jgi:predicted dehydrogenase